MRASEHWDVRNAQRTKKKWKRNGKIMVVLRKIYTAMGLELNRKLTLKLHKPLCSICVCMHKTCGSGTCKAISVCCMPVCLASFKSIPHLDSSPQKLCASFFYFISLGMFLTNRVIFPIYFVPFWKSLVAERFTREKCVNTPHSIKWVRSCESKRCIYIYVDV